MEAYKALVTIQSELKAPKGQYNSFGKYNYRSCEDIVEAVKPLLLKTNTVLVINDKITLVGDRYYVEAEAKLVSVDDGSSVQSVAYAREDDQKAGMSSSQVTGATSSYARKYALNGLLAIDDTKDADATNTHGKEDTSKKPQSTGTKSPQMASANAVTFPSGKYSGQEVAKCSDKNYLKWVVETSTFNASIKAAAKAAL